MKTQAEIRAEISAVILAALDKGRLPWRKPWAGGMPYNGASGHEYKGINRLLLSCSIWDNPMFLTEKQIHEAGGMILPIQANHGHTVIFYRKWEIVNDKLSPEGTAQPEVKAIPVLKEYKVWNIEQTTLKIPAIERPDIKPIEEAEVIAKGYADAPPVTHGGGRACYSPALDTITMPHMVQFVSAEEYYSALFHELAHSTGHEKRLARPLDKGMFGNSEYAFEELVAEISAAFLCGYCGLHNVTLDNSIAYLQSWKRAVKDNDRAVFIASAMAEKAARYICPEPRISAPRPKRETATATKRKANPTVSRGKKALAAMGLA